ncbi:UDP-N-acetylglucosamine 1-carboxyvinyltransferase [Sphingobacteriales bacterium UPWRP_1]|nr:UDP-N-acetylglucosamine 1-carboxyvinyltransferase [Sphingobacteriales bacterium TSM_CSM]PSJ71714.1 UDP-N-acetylglucosamine 1-carboxyvinyltransferase [Sphingobacteriales bacterium UPWRP_1]
MTDKDTFVVWGGNRLKGALVPQGAKNEALQIISATLLTDEEVTISNIPDIQDVNKLIEILKDMGVEIHRLNADTCTFKANKVDLHYLDSEEFRLKTGKLRGSVLTIGPLLARFKRAYLPRPGGDKIGRRRLDTHFLGLQLLGATFNYSETENAFTVSAPQLKGSYILMEEASITGTANILMAAVLAEGVTTIYNAACEPYIQQLCHMLNSMGAKISGVGSNLLTVEGVQKLRGCQHRILPDMLEIGSFIGLAALTQSEITIKNARVDQLGIIPALFSHKLGIQLEIRGDDIFIPQQDCYEIGRFIDGSILTIADAPWPGISPDLMSVVLVTATQARGSVLVHQKMFESRLFFVDKLIDMGAQIILCDPHRAVVIGLERRSPLRGINMSSPDIRAGVALLIAALSAEGKSVISNIHQIDRGYQHIDRRLQAIGAQIERV